MKLLRIYYSLNYDKSLKQMQFEYSNGMMSDKTGFLGRMTNFTVDQSRTVKQVAVKMSSWNNFFGLRLIDEGGRLIVDEEWSEDKGKWTEPKTIPDGEEIIGLKWVDMNFNNCIQITRLAFLLWTPNYND